ncbi:MAG: hypothetical protein Q4G68_10155 [Planctomycetia bacterium]|nr:hypothetical protein [Planctomycetia bacterium]
MKKFQWQSIVVSTVCLFSVLSGCNLEKRPEGFPRLTPCVVTILQNGTPLADANVTFHGEDAEKWGITGRTDASGSAVMTTYGKYNGVPAGTYKITLAKEDFQGPAASDDPTAPMSKEPTKIFSFVELKYTAVDSTPLEITVEKSSINMDINAGEPVHVLSSTMDADGI